jgi:hypothetical protein
MIGVNMNKAKDIWRDKIRADRTAELNKLDVEYMRALEAGDTTKQAEIVSKKQALRDAPADERIDNATSPEELKNLDIVKEIVS